MKTLLTLLLLAASAFGQTATISDTIRTPFGGTFSGTVTVSLNSPALAQPLYSGSITLSGWTQTVTVTAGVFTLTLYTNDLITPGGTSYTATYAPTSGSGWKETWIVPAGATTIREIRSTTVPSPSVRFTPSQITQAGATLGQGLKWDGLKWAPADVVANPMTTNGDLITRLGGVPVRVGIGTTNQVLTVSGGMPVWASGITGNASTATALAADPANCGAGTLPRGVDASGAGQNCAAVALASEVTGTLPNANTTAASTNTASAIVARDASGNFAAGTVTAALAGNASTATALQTARTIAGASFDGTANINIASTGLSDSSALVRNNQANTYTAGNKQTFASNATTAGAAFGGGITVDPSSVSAGDFWYRADLGTFGYRNATAVDAMVAGGRALSAPGSVPFVTSAGVLGQSGNLFWDNANGRLGIGRNNPSTVLHVEAANPAVTLTRTAISNLTITNGGSGVWSYTANGGQGLSFGITGGAEWARLAPSTGNLLLGTTTDDGTNRLQVAGGGLFAGNLTVSNQGTNGYLRIFDSTPAASNPAKFLTVASGQLRFYNNAYAASLMALADNGNLLLGTTMDGNFKLDVADSGSSGGLRVWDQRATIGSTSLVVRAGAGQGGNNLQTWQNSSGTGIANVDSIGRINSQIGFLINTSGGAVLSPFSGTLGGFARGFAVGWGDASDAAVHASGYLFRGTTGTTTDLSLSRASANTLQVGDGGANSNGTILARIHTWANGTEGTCDATLRGQVVMVQGGAGVADTFRVCRKDAANAYAWTALY